jgi:DHA1 family bicyclomycin/chloramphenicol resistance-like MFS transporter
VNRQFFLLAIVLGLITAVGPFAVDMYLPALPSMGRNLQAAPGAVQMSLMAFFIVIGVCQLFYGPLSDIVGRKPPIYGGLVIFAGGSIGCALAPDIDVLIAFRVIQAFGACAGMVVPRAIVRDLHTGHDATRLMSLLMLVVSVSPLLAPLTGSFVIAVYGWRGVFVVLTIAAGIGFLLALTQLKETRPAHSRGGSSWASAFSAYGLLLHDREFTGLTLVGALGTSAFFVYLGSASFVFINHYGLTPRQFSLCFALNAASFFGFSQLTGTLTQRFGLSRIIRAATGGFALAMLLVGILFAFGADNIFLMMSLLFIGYGFLGLVLPAAAVLSLEHHGAIAGTASALMGSLQMIVGSAIMALAGLFANGTPRPMLLGIAGCAVSSFVVALIIVKPAPKAAAVTVG